jgi:type II secretory pathway component PulJ
MAQRRAWARSSKRPGTGYSVLELVIALLISVAAMLIASQLLFEAQRRSTHAARQVLDPAIILIIKQIRYDVQAAATASGRRVLWSWAGTPPGRCATSWPPATWCGRWPPDPD